MYDYNNEIRETFGKKNLVPFMKKSVSTGYRFSRPTLLLLDMERTQDISHSQPGHKSRRHTLLCMCLNNHYFFVLNESFRPTGTLNTRPWFTHT